MRATHASMHERVLREWACARARRACERAHVCVRVSCALRALGRRATRTSHFLAQAQPKTFSPTRLLSSLKLKNKPPLRRNAVVSCFETDKCKFALNVMNLHRRPRAHAHRAFDIQRAMSGTD